MLMRPHSGNLTRQAGDGAYPRVRMRRNRSAPWLRRMVAESHIAAEDLIVPLFVTKGAGVREAVPAMPGVDRLSVDLAAEKAARAADLGVSAIALFPVTPQARKCPLGAEAHNPDNLICRAIRHIKQSVPDIGIVTDVALDPYTDHGHDGILREGIILNDETVESLCAQALVQAKAGADVIAPSDMMDGRVGAIRDALDAAGYADVKILAYAAKYASAYYGPFREAVNSAGCLQGGKAAYQMDPANSDEALREVALDLQEGADMVMVKPGLPYLDIVRRVKERFGVPTLGYHVSGEYAMLRHAALAGAVNYEKVLMETLLCFKRAGADAILTYAALDAAEIIRQGGTGRDGTGVS